MYNYEHEIECPDNKAIRKFLWNDYFHDSELLDIRFDREWRKVLLTLESCRDIDNAWERLKGDGDTRHQYIEGHKDEYIYTLLFLGTVYFHVERMMYCGDYINGRFKDTALLRRLQSGSKKPLYHFRIQFADGYADILFDGFQIRKQTGRVNYAIPY